MYMGECRNWLPFFTQNARIVTGVQLLVYEISKIVLLCEIDMVCYSNNVKIKQ